MISSNKKNRTKWYEILIEEFVKGITEDGAKRTFQVITSNHIRRRNSNPHYFSWMRNLDISGFPYDFINFISKLCKEIKLKKDRGI